MACPLELLVWFEDHQVGRNYHTMQYSRYLALGLNILNLSKKPEEGSINFIHFKAVWIGTNQYISEQPYLVNELLQSRANLEKI